MQRAESGREGRAEPAPRYPNPKWRGSHDPNQNWFALKSVSRTRKRSAQSLKSRMAPPIQRFVTMFKNNPGRGDRLGGMDTYTRNDIRWVMLTILVGSYQVEKFG